MVIVTVTKKTFYFFEDRDIEAMARDENMSFEDCKATLLGREFELPEIEANCGCDYGVIEDYEAVEENFKNF